MLAQPSVHPLLRAAGVLVPLFATTLVFAPSAIVPVTICLVAGLLIIQNIVSPRVLGSAVGLDPILVLAAVFVSTQSPVSWVACSASLWRPLAPPCQRLAGQVRPPRDRRAGTQGGGPEPESVASKPTLELDDSAASATDILAAARAELAEAQEELSEDEQAVEDKRPSTS